MLNKKEGTAKGREKRKTGEREREKEREEGSGGSVVGEEQRALDESETQRAAEYEALWTIEAEVQFTGLPRSVYFVSVLMEWLRFRTGQRSLFPPIRRIIKIVLE